MRVGNGAVFTALACLSAIGTAVGFSLTATKGIGAVSVLSGSGAGLCILLVLLGSSRWIGATSVLMVAAIMLEAGFGDEPSATRSMLLGCSWFLTLELAWEAIDRREQAQRSRDSEQRRLQEVVTVVGLTVLAGAVAVSLTAFAPLRSVLLQALVIGTVLAGFVTLVRRVVPGEAGE